MFRNPNGINKQNLVVKYDKGKAEEANTQQKSISLEVALLFIVSLLAVLSVLFSGNLQKSTIRLEKIEGNLISLNKDIEERMKKELGE